VIIFAIKYYATCITIAFYQNHTLHKVAIWTEYLTYGILFLDININLDNNIPFTGQGSLDSEYPVEGIDNSTKRKILKTYIKLSIDFCQTLLDAKWESHHTRPSLVDRHQLLPSLHSWNGSLLMWSSSQSFQANKTVPWANDLLAARPRMIVAVNTVPLAFNHRFPFSGELGLTHVSCMFWPSFLYFPQ
jgi:hypothetical protein